VIDTSELPGLEGWSPRPVTSVETIEPGPVAALSALLDSGLPPVAVGDALPPLWHWVALPRWPASSVIGLDGHPRRGDFLPPLDLPRRMFAGGRVVLHGDLTVGKEVDRESVVDAVTPKRGRTGPFAVVQVTTLLRDPGGDVLLEERQDLVFRDAPAPVDRPADPGPAAGLTPAGPPLQPEGAGWRFVTDPTLLMRFSSATANPHRIHYDWPYATQVEGYPGLVVHGPLSTIALAETLRLTGRGVPRIRSLEHRNLAPLFCGTPARIQLETDMATATAVLRDGAGTPLSRLVADLSPGTDRHP
jgi:3-methylfumaryl-CoA hydratase